MIRIAVPALVALSMLGCASSPDAGNDPCRISEQELRNGMRNGDIASITLLDDEIAFVGWKGGAIGCSRGIEKAELFRLVSGSGIHIVTEYSDVNI